jgi:two-component system NarL family sensor kinase
MIDRKLSPFAMNLPSSSRSQEIGLIVGLFILVLGLELATPIEYVCGYLYTGPILLTNARFGRSATFIATIGAVLLTLLNLWIPGTEPIETPSIANRTIAVLALIVTGSLSERIRGAREAIAQQRAQLNAREQLIEIQEDFTSTLTHDLKTPLLGAIETIKAYQQEKFGAVTAMQQRVLATMSRSHQNSLQLVETLLDVYRNDRSGLSLHLTPLDLGTLVEDSIASITPLASTSQVYLFLNYGESDFRQILWVKGDAFQLQRVLTNLLINAINHSRREGRIEIRLESGTSYQAVKIIDNGSGITATEFPHLFDRFYQSHSDRQAKGTGLGLYLSRQIIEAHSGTIWAENRSPERGAIFAFRLPVYANL